MATWTLEATDFPTLLPMRHRSPGVHVSDCVKELCKLYGTFAPWEKAPDVSQCEIGSAVEHSIKTRFLQNEIRRLGMEEPGSEDVADFLATFGKRFGDYLNPGEISLDGIFGHPDLIDLNGAPIEDRASHIVDEIKCAWMHTREADDEALFRYVKQNSAYCKMWGTTHGRLTVIFINGKGDMRSEPRRWRLEHDPVYDLECDWAMMLDVAETLRTRQ